MSLRMLDSLILWNVNINKEILLVMMLVLLKEAAEDCACVCLFVYVGCRLLWLP